MFWQQLPPRLPPRLRERRCRAAAPGAAPPFHAAFSRSLPVGVLQSNNQTVSSTLRTHVFLPDLAQVQLHARCMQGCSAMQAALIDPHAVSPPSPRLSGRCLQNPPGKPAAMLDNHQRAVHRLEDHLDAVVLRARAQVRMQVRLLGLSQRASSARACHHPALQPLCCTGCELSTASRIWACDVARAAHACGAGLAHVPHEARSAACAQRPLVTSLSSRTRWAWARLMLSLSRTLSRARTLGAPSSR